MCRCWVSCGEQKLYTVCDVAMHIIMSKSTTYSLESPKDPVLPSRYFTKPDKVGLPCVAVLWGVFCFSWTFRGRTSPESWAFFPFGT